MGAKVHLLSHTPDPEGSIARAARLCYSSLGLDELKGDLAREDQRRLLRKILSLGHHSVLEHASFTFGIEGVSRIMTHQLVRHRMASFSQQSQRYVEYRHSLPTVMPDSIAGEERLRHLFLEQCSRAFALYREMCEAGIPAEDARYLLPGASETKVIVTMNGRELRHVFRLRCCERSQWEIRRTAEAMLELVRPLAPVVFADAGPSCLTGPCPEGEMTCGKMKAVRARYGVPGKGEKGKKRKGETAC